MTLKVILKKILVNQLYHIIGGKISKIIYLVVEKSLHLKKKNEPTVRWWKCSGWSDGAQNRDLIETDTGAFVVYFILRIQIYLDKK